MSAWRRIAIEHVPSCQKTIEEAKDPSRMWIDLYHELYDCHIKRGHPIVHTINEQKSSEIYQFAFLCLNNKVHLLLSLYVGAFFGYVLNCEMEYLLQHHPGQLTHLKKIYPEDFPSDISF